LRLLAALLLFTETVAVLVDFFIPIDIYLTSGKLTLVILFTVVSGIPPAFGYLLGRVADSQEKHRLAAVACVAMALILFALSLPIPYLFTILAGLGLGIVIELLSVLRQALATRLTPAERWGRLDSVFQIVSCIADIGAPPLLGAALDLAGLPVVAAVLAAFALLLALVFIVNVHPRRGKHLSLNVFSTLPPPEHAV
jgi:MFS family permease